MRRRKAKVVSLYGAVPPHGEPEAGIVELLSDLLREAKAGAISGVLVGGIGPSHAIGLKWEGRACVHEMIAASAMLHSRVLATWAEHMSETGKAS